ncbi:hypothetical protein KI688_011366 [Linnemannia hyalina]|uniref:T-box domain-containing protein n=1 Tax=Linnemannia hyalina TaxID=64524 RepID=A0A9P8BT23_9FUNG|nr:hypothetical protein KI688_011366 [Linnemannia hyalina]
MLPWYRSMHLSKPAPSQIRPFEQREPTEAEVRSAQSSSQSLQDNSSGRPSKRRRGEQYGPMSPLSSPSRTSQSDRLALSTRRTSAALALLNSSGTRHDGPQPKVLLLDSDLWAQFDEHQNEMIITTSGRCLFPSLRFNVFNLNPDAYYSFCLEFEMLTPNRFRFSNGAWKAVRSPKNIDDSSTAIATAASDHKGETYTHPDQLKLGSHWMANPISFAKAKLANKAKSQPTVAKKALKLNSISTSSSKRKADSTSATNSNDGPGRSHSQPLGDSHNDTNVFHMESFHKYRPRVVLTELAKDSNEILSTTAYTFDLATYMAVTRYENENVNDLKKSFNPHARAFRETVGKIPARGFHRPQELQKHSSLVNPNSRLSKRARPTSRPKDTGSDSEDVTDLDYDLYEEEEVDINADVSDLEAMCSVDVAMTGILKNDARPTCRLGKDNSALVTISLGKDAKQVAKVSKQTTQQHYAQHRQVSQHGGEIDILRPHSHFTPKGVFSMGQQFFSAQNTSGSSFAQLAHFHGAKQQQQYRQREPQHQSQWTPSGGSGSQYNSWRGEQQKNAFSQPLFFEKASNTRQDRGHAHLSDANHTPTMTIPLSPHISSVPNWDDQAHYDDDYNGQNGSDGDLYNGSITGTVEAEQQVHLDRILFENECLKAFVRERYGTEAESEMTAFLAIDQQQ